MLPKTHGSQVVLSFDCNYEYRVTSYGVSGSDQLRVYRGIVVVDNTNSVLRSPGVNVCEILLCKLGLLCRLGAGCPLAPPFRYRTDYL